MEWAGAATGLAGAALLALHVEASGWGFVFFLASNVAWMGFGILTRAWGLVTMQLGFMATSVTGIFRWLV